MAFLGNSDATGGGSGVMLFDTAAEITGMAAAKMNVMKIGTKASAVDTGAEYTLVDTAGTRSFKILV